MFMETDNIDEIPKGTLLNIMKRKEKELRTAVSRLEHLQVKTDLLERQNVILQADRKSFRALANRLHADMTAFEAATAKDEPVDLDELVGSINFTDYKKILLAFYKNLFDETLVLPDDEDAIFAFLGQVAVKRRISENTEIAKLRDQFDHKLQEIFDLQQSLELVRAECSELCVKVHSRDAEISQLRENNTSLEADLRVKSDMIGNLKLEISRLNAESEERNEEFAKLIFQQESEILELRSQISALKLKQKEFDDLASLAERQAERDREIFHLRKEIEKLSQPKQTNYLKSVLIKWLLFVKDADPKRFALVPVLEELLHLNDLEKHIVQSL
jgi:DNA repair exonuclease SbcCD ATPase subunit